MSPQALLVLALALTAPSLAQEGPVFHADVSQVHVDAEVVGPDGRILTGFSKSDFRVFDQGAEQAIVGFSAGEQPLDLILLFDISGSMQAVVDKVASAASQGLHELRPGDRVSVMVFNTRVRVVSGFTGDLDAVARTIQEDVLHLNFGGGTFIQKGVDEAALQFTHENRTERRRAVLIITDNNGMRTRREATVVRDYWEADALLSGLIVRNRAYQTVLDIQTAMSPETMWMHAGMKGIAEKTGGDSINSDDPGAGFQEMLHRIRSRFSLYYAMPPGKPGATRSVRVELTADARKRFPKARVRARHGYRVPAPASAAVE
ncbi:MAG TPA: VWA domain-containing protein [Bryobacteraceae bacterium]|nr:VWA domain-containing protein [Bryobacteraceae bacterium]